MKTVKPYLKVEKTDKHSLAPIYLRIIENRKVSTMSLGFKSRVKDWNDTAACARKSHPQQDEVNSAIKLKIAELTSQHIAAVEQPWIPSDNIYTQAYVEQAVVEEKKIQQSLERKIAHLTPEKPGLPKTYLLRRRIRCPDAGREQVLYPSHV